MKSISISFDVEPDIHTGKYESILNGLPKITELLNKYEVKATFFVTCDVLENFPRTFKELEREGNEIALHGYKHERYDELGKKEKEIQIQKAILSFQHNLEKTPEGFRAPQHSIDSETLNLLEKYQFKYDSSYTPFNLLQILFFPKKFRLKDFFSKIRKYKIRKNLYEFPISSFLFPAVSLIFRIFPKILISLYFSFLKIINQNIVLYFHSWDFIDIPNSKIARRFPKEKLIENLDYFLKKNKKNFTKLIDLI